MAVRRQLLSVMLVWLMALAVPFVLNGPMAFACRSPSQNGVAQ